MPDGLKTMVGAPVPLKHEFEMYPTSLDIVSSTDGREQRAYVTGTGGLRDKAPCVPVTSEIAKAISRKTHGFVTTKLKITVEVIDL